jgi:uncharacterized membrane protein YidH (DUF202 family)
MNLIINTFLPQFFLLQFEILSFNGLTEQESINQFLQNLFHDFFIIGGILYIIFAIVVIRQIHVMKKTLITTFSPIIEIIGYIHLVLSVLVLLFYIVLL